MELLGAALLFSTGGAAIKATQFQNWQVAGFRSGIAAVAILLLVPGSRRNWSWRAALVGVAYAATLILFVTANKMTTAANTIFLQAAAPLYLVLLDPWLLRERPRREDWLTLVAIAAGMALFFAGTTPPSQTAPQPFRGNVLAAISGLAWAFTLVGLRWMGMQGTGERGMTTVVIGNLIAFAFCLPLALPVTQAAPSDWVTISYLGVFQIGLAYLLLTRGVRRVPAIESSLLLMLEPALNPVWAYLVHGENPGRFAIGGGALIVGATLARVIAARRGPAEGRMVK